MSQISLISMTNQFQSVINVKNQIKTRFGKGNQGAPISASKGRQGAPRGAKGRTYTEKQYNTYEECLYKES